MKKWIKLLVLIAALVLVWSIYSSFFPLNDKQKIESVINSASNAIEDQNLRRFSTFLSDNFTVESHNKEQVLERLRGFFFQTKSLKVSIKYLKHENEDISPDTDKARVFLVAVVTGLINNQKFQAFGEGGADAILLSMSKANGQWLIAKANYVNITDPAKAFETFN